MPGNFFPALRTTAAAVGLACLAVSVIASSAGAVEHNVVLRKPLAVALADETRAPLQRLIVKMRESDPDRAQAQSATGGENSASAVSRRQARVQSLAQRVGIALRESRELSPNLQVVSVGPAVYGETAAETLARLREDPAVEFAEVDQRRYAHALANDPFFEPGNSTSGQWYLGEGASTPAAIHATTAWDTTTGSAGMVIAVLDTGVLFDHPDLKRVADGGRLLPGYDFVSADPGNPNSFLVANDGGGRDADASDPGDWISPTDTNNSRFDDCEVSDSSWHGTRVAGIIGARTNTSVPEGIAGITWAPQILPVRVLGKCGGFDSDIIAAMRWAAGLHVNGVDDNSHPAKIINLSLGSVSNCSNSYRNVVSELTGLGVLIVASAGNEVGQSVDSPANCAGVLAVAGLRHIGTKVGYSNMGPEIGIAAPAGNCVNDSGPCLYPIDTTSNSGTRAADPNGHTYTNSYNTNLGTSFSAPIVAAAAALVRSLDASLTPAQVIARLQQTATPFPAPSGTAVCPSTNPNSGECACTTSTCGAGMLNVAAAIAATVPVTTPPTPPPPTTPSSNGSGGGGSLGWEWLALAGLWYAARLRRRSQLRG